MQDVDLLTVAAAGRILGLTPDGVRYLERRGKLSAIRTSTGIRLFNRAAIEQYARERATR